MIKKHSKTRRAYESMYRQFRLDDDVWEVPWKEDETDEIIDCALVSYEARWDYFSGWINSQRQHWFAILQQAIVFREDFFR
jgi:hypothetical protein